MLFITRKVIIHKSNNLNNKEIKEQNSKIIPDKWTVLYDSENNEFVEINENDIEEALWMWKTDEFYEDPIKSTPRSIVKDEEIYWVLNKPAIYYDIWNKEITDDDIIWYIDTEGENTKIKITKAEPTFKILDLINYIQKKHKFKVSYTLNTYTIDGVVMKDNDEHEIIIMDLRYKYKMYDITLRFNSLNENIWWRVKKIEDIDSFLKKHLYN